MAAAVDRTLIDVALALLDFGHSPGKYAVHLGAPKLLHQHMDTVALWALGRWPDGLLNAVPARPDALAQAAVLFVQRVCFAPGNNHYQVLGLRRDTFNTAQLRTRYRSLIRLTHPDMGLKGLPTDAAGMVNRAYTVLGDDSARHAYDAQLLAKPAPANPPPAPHATARRAAAAVKTVPRPAARRPGAYTPEPASAWVVFKARHPHWIRAGLLLSLAGLMALGLWLAMQHGADQSHLLVVNKSAPLPQGRLAPTAQPEPATPSSAPPTGLLWTPVRATPQPPPAP